MNQPTSQILHALPSRRPRRAKLVPLILAALILSPTTLTSTSTTSQAAVAPDTRPNVVLITTDDMTRTDLRWMPKTRALLAARGVDFVNFISPHPLCCPARAEMITGQYAQNNGVHSNGGKYGGLPSLRNPNNTLTTWLHDAGYRTGLSGKYLNGYNPTTIGIPSGWDFWDAFAGNGAGYYGFTMYDNGTRVTYPEDGIYSSDLIADDTESMIRDFNHPDRQPFFIWSSYFAPHGLCSGVEAGCAMPPAPARRHRDAYPDAENPAADKPSFNEPDVSDKPAMIRYRDPESRAEMQHLFLRRIRALQAVDEGVAQTIAALRDTGELDNTLILFTSDNGYLLGEHRYHGKVVPYEEALRVPLLMRGPGLPVDVDRSTGATTVDLAPTIVAMTGVDAGRVMDGRNLLPYTKDGSLTHSPTSLIQAGPKASDPDPLPWMYRGVRTPRYTFVRWTEDGFVELYDRANDPFQLHNVANWAKYLEVRQALADQTRDLTDCSGAECRRWFPDLPWVARSAS